MSAILGPVGGPGVVLGPMLAVLGLLGASVGGLGGDQGEQWPWPERVKAIWVWAFVA